MNDLIYWVWLAQKNGAGHSDANKILKKFVGGAREIYEAPYERIAAVTECSPVFLKRLRDHDLTEAERILEFCFLNGIRVISCMSPNYPKRLNSLFNKPIILYVRGMIEDLDERFCVSIVGTRSMSGYGKHITFTLARQLIAYGAIIISGAAYGIDSAANNTAVFMEEPTVAVLGSGVNVPYPAKNKDMLDYIAGHGMVVSEFPPNTAPLGRHFPIRNRIISGLADAVVVVEAGEKSGALITARCAQEQGRMVYAVPGNLGVPNSVGTNNMIRDGAKMVTRTEDIIEDFADKFNLAKIDRIINSDKYLRYEYNHNIPMRAENKPLTPEEQDRGIGLAIPKSRSFEPEMRMPDIPTPADFRRTDKEVQMPPAERIIHKREPERKVPVKRADPVPQDSSVSNERDKVLKLLDDTQRRVFDAIPDGEAIGADKIVESGIPTDVVLSSLTMLELYSAVEALPGGLYKKII